MGRVSTAEAYRPPRPGVLNIHPSSSGSVGANNYRACWIEFEDDLTLINRAFIRVHANGGTGNITVDLRNDSGYLVVGTGAIATPATGYGELTLTETLVPKGLYVAGLSCDSATPTFSTNGAGNVKGAILVASAHPPPNPVPTGDNSGGAVPVIGFYYA